MKIELKAIQYSAFASQETNCYSANLYVDGKKIGTVSNQGHGGCDLFYGDQEAYQEADKWCRENLPKWSLGGGSSEAYETDLEQHCGDLLATWLDSRDLKRRMRNHIVFRMDGSLYLAKFTGDQTVAASQVQKRHPTAKVLNTLPFDQALTIYTVSHA